MPPRALASRLVGVFALAAIVAGACRPAAAPTVSAAAPPPAPPPASTPEDEPASLAAPSPIDADADAPPLAAAPTADDAPLPYPGLNDQYRARPRARTWAARFEREGREVYQRRRAIVRNLHLRTGQKIADVGAGTGLFTLPLAEAVGPEGRVYAVDLMPSFLAHIGERCRRAGVTNVTLVQSSARSTHLEEGSIDLAFLSDAYHHLEDPAAILGSIRRALRPGGELVIIDFERIPGVSPAWIFDHVRAGKEVVLAEAAAAGFVPDPTEPEVALLRENYFIRLRRG